MSYLYRNNFSTEYEADIGSILKINDPSSKYNNRLIYEHGSTFNGYCYKDYNNFKNNPDEVCYIAEGEFDDTLFVDFVNENKEKLIQEGGISTTNSIKDEIKQELEYMEYFYEYQKDGVVHTIEAKNFDEEIIDKIAEVVIDIVDWQTTQAYICETDWTDTISDYYKAKINGEELEI